MSEIPAGSYVVEVDAGMVRATFDDITQSDDMIDVWIGKATRLLYEKAPCLYGRLSRQEIDPELVADKIIEAVGRVLRSPDPRFLVEAELGYRYQLNQRTASGTLWYPEEDLALLCGPSPTTYGSFSLNPSSIWSDHQPRSGEVWNADQRR